METSQQLANVGIMFPDDAEDFISQQPEGTFTVLDVRQPMEYESEHLPGAKLIPLPELPDSLNELDPEKPLIVYCAVGGRSRMAAQLLANHDFKKVYYVEGGEWRHGRGLLLRDQGSFISNLLEATKPRSRLLR